MTNVRTLPVGEGNEEIQDSLDQLAREGARRMIAAGLRAEADEYVERFSDEADEDGCRLVVRNGRARERRVTVGSGTIESSFATVRLRTRVTKGTGSKTAALAMAYKLLESAQERWRQLNRHELVTDVLAGAKFKDGIKVTEDDNHDDGLTDERVAA
jgi:hypothetical protein